MRFQTPLALAIGILLTLSFSGKPAEAQTLVKTIYGAAAGDHLSWSAAAIGDVNGDGITDLAVGSNWWGSTNMGRVNVHSGANYAVLYSITGMQTYDRIGTSIAALGQDVNGDGKPDFVVGGDGVGAGNPGEAYIVSGANGSTLKPLPGAGGSDDYFATSLGSGGDINGNGFADVVVGAPSGHHGSIPRPGYIRAYDGGTGQLIFENFGPNADDYLGITSGVLGDLTNDGRAEYFASAPYADVNGPTSGMVRIYNGATGAKLRDHYGTAAGDNFGLSAANAGDVTGDGVNDLIVGAPYADNGGLGERGAAYVYNGKTGALYLTLWGEKATDLFGQSVASAGDVNGDGRGDLIVGAIWADQGTNYNEGSFTIFSGANGAQLGKVYGGTANLQLGSHVYPLGDINNDGSDDVAVGSYLDDTNGSDAGLLRIYHGNSTPYLTFAPPCSGGTGTSPQLTITPDPTPGTTLTFKVTGAVAGGEAKLLIGYGHTPTTLFGCPVYPSPTYLLRTSMPNTNSSGATQKQFTLPANLPPGTALYIQAVIYKNNKVATTQAVQAQVQ